MQNQHHQHHQQHPQHGQTYRRGETSLSYRNPKEILPFDAQMQQDNKFMQYPANPGDEYLCVACIDGADPVTFLRQGQNCNTNETNQTQGLTLVPSDGTVSADYKCMEAYGLLAPGSTPPRGLSPGGQELADVCVCGNEDGNNCLSLKELGLPADQRMFEELSNLEKDFGAADRAVFGIFNEPNKPTPNCDYVQHIMLGKRASDQLHYQNYGINEPGSNRRSMPNVEARFGPGYFDELGQQPFQPTADSFGPN